MLIIEQIDHIQDDNSQRKIYAFRYLQSNRLLFININKKNLSIGLFCTILVNRTG